MTAGVSRRAVVCGAATLALLLTAHAAGASGKGVEGVVNLNTAPPATLALLSGIGPAKVQSILDYRRRHPFRTVDELVRIKGIGHKMVKRLRSHLAVNGPTTARAAPHLPLVTATEAPVPTKPPEKKVVALRPRLPLLAGRHLVRPAQGSQPRARANHCLVRR